MTMWSLQSSKLYGTSRTTTTSTSPISTTTTSRSDTTSSTSTSLTSRPTTIQLDDASQFVKLANNMTCQINQHHTLQVKPNGNSNNRPCFIINCEEKNAIADTEFREPRYKLNSLARSGVQVLVSSGLLFKKHIASLWTSVFGDFDVFEYVKDMLRSPTLPSTPSSTSSSSTTSALA
eukprot:3440021-Amphidinium_carterae.1